jgi:hypothetical protein
MSESSPMDSEVCKSADMLSCAIEWQPSEAAFDVWPPKTERASQGKRPRSVPRSAWSTQSDIQDDALAPDGVEC